MEVGKVDLHMHSVYSDGANSPIELMEMAKESNITTMALTDHDNILGSKELMKLNDGGIYLYSGVELTAKVDKGRMHILGYNIDLENERLEKRLEEMKEAAIYNLLLYVEVLKHDFGIYISPEKLKEMAYVDGNVGRPQLALLLIESGYAKCVDEAFSKYLIAAYDKVRKIKKGLSKEECIDLITSAGGVAVLAHPVSLKMNDLELDKEIEYLKSLGLGGIEVIHINNDLVNRVKYHNLAIKYNLLETGGTDFHGVKVKPDVMMGSGRDGNVSINEGELSLVKNIRSRYMKR